MPKRTDLHHVMVIGSGPIVIGQACEFDYSGTQACRVLRKEGLRVTLVNSNPATIMTDTDFADHTYVEPIEPEFIDKILAKEIEQGHPVDAVLATLGGQTALNAAIQLDRQGILKKYNVSLIGADIEAIERGEGGRGVRPLPCLPQHGRGTRDRQGARPPRRRSSLVHYGRPGLRARLHLRGSRPHRRRRTGCLPGGQRAHRGIDPRVEGI